MCKLFNYSGLLQTPGSASQSTKIHWPERKWGFHHGPDRKWNPQHDALLNGKSSETKCWEEARSPPLAPAKKIPCKISQTGRADKAYQLPQIFCRCPGWFTGFCRPCPGNPGCWAAGHVRWKWSVGFGWDIKVGQTHPWTKQNKKLIYYVSRFSSI